MVSAKYPRFLCGIGPWASAIAAALAVLTWTSPAQAEADSPPKLDGERFVPDPATVQRFGAGYRYPQKGWIVLHLEGSPYERGVQHGRLLAPEIAGYLRCYAVLQSTSAAEDAWRLMRTLVNSVFLRGFDREYLDEMKGIADGASAAGARFDNRALDLVDIAALNLWPELMTLDAANEATPTGLEGVDFPESGPVPPKATQEGHCSAFAATGKATRDGHAIIGHITMFGLYPSLWYNVWLDIQPTQGHRLTMQSYPGGICSGMDYYLNSAGIAMVETTIEQTRFDSTGKPQASRVRKAMQYADSISAAVAILREGNNGLYNNEWLLADMNTDEIAMLELGTHQGKLWRSSENEWFGGTTGFYWGCNNAKDIGMRLEAIPATHDRPANLVWHPSERDLKWIDLYQTHFGSIDEGFARQAFTTAPLCAPSSVDVKFTTPALARAVKSWAIFGPPRERTWMPTVDERMRYKDIRPLVSNPWTILGPAERLSGPGWTAKGSNSKPIDLHDPAGQRLSPEPSGEAKDSSESPPTARLAWHGTLQPATDADLWLASAFAEYEGHVRAERGYAEAQSNKCLCGDDYDKVSESLFAARARYFSGVRLGGDVALAKLTWSPGSSAWYKIASGKGLLVLAELRRLMGDAAFLPMMDQFGRSHAGQRVSSARFAASATKAAGQDLTPFFEYWLNQPGLPEIELLSANASAEGVHGVLRAKAGPLPSKIEVTLEFADGELTQVVALDAEGRFDIPTSKPINRLIIDKYGRVARANGGQAGLGAFAEGIDHTLIVYGTLDDTAANREAADACQRELRARWLNIDLPIKSDASITEDELKTHHLILIGRPTANRITERVAAHLPVSFGPASFVVRGQTYAHMNTAVLAATLNPFNPRLSINLIAGNSATATLEHAGELAHRGGQTEVRIFPASGKTKSIVVPAPTLMKSFGTGKLAQTDSAPAP